MGSTQWLWFISRGSGLVLLALFTAVAVLGIATRLGWAPLRWPRFVAAELHRILALFAVALLTLHAPTAIADPYVSIGWAATVLPFLSPYRAAAIGLGTLAVDLAAAVLLTSLLRYRLGPRAWRAVHWLAYLAWPAAFGHALTAGGDLHTGWVAAIVWGSAAAMTIAMSARLAVAAWTRLTARTRRAPGALPGAPARAVRSAPVSRGPSPQCLPPAPPLAVAWPRLLPGAAADDSGPGDLREHLARHGARPPCAGDWQRRQRLIDEVERAGLTGRGGAAFPAAVKIRAAATSPRAPVVIANGVEGEPASAKDKVLFSCAPHLVIDGAVSAAELAGAGEAVIVAHPAACEAVRRAVGERAAVGCDPVPVRVLEAAGGFTAGEASAVVHWTEHGTPVPTGRPPRLGGPGRRPALVHNVETLAHLALIVRHGASWFRTAGTPAEPGTMLVTLLGRVRHPGVYEVEPGTRVSDVLGLAGGTPEEPGALLIGGYFGTWAAAADALPLPFSAAGLSPLGARPGAGVVAVLPSAACGLAETARLARYLARSSAGQCGPCVLGLDAIARELEQAAVGSSCDLPRLRRWLRDVTGRGACRHPDGTALMVASALRVFRAEIGLHSRGWCSATASAGILPVADRPP